MILSGIVTSMASSVIGNLAAAHGKKRHAVVSLDAEGNVVSKSFDDPADAGIHQDMLAESGSASIVLMERPDGSLDCRHPVRVRRPRREMGASRMRPSYFEAGAKFPGHPGEASHQLPRKPNPGVDWQTPAGLIDGDRADAEAIRRQHSEDFPEIKRNDLPFYQRTWATDTPLRELPARFAKSPFYRGREYPAGLVRVEPSIPSSQSRKAPMPPFPLHAQGQARGRELDELEDREDERRRRNLPVLPEEAADAAREAISSRSASRRRFERTPGDEPPGIDPVDRVLMRTDIRRNGTHVRNDRGI